ncbi:rIIA protector from prophage-induced early lysis [Klebsiella phage CPRSA]|nr:rIIA protector from prophage-induced early lysis [Klebsiella phage CPRSA]
MQKMHNLSRVSFVAYYDSDSKREIVNDIVRKGHFDESEIVYLRTSEMTKEKRSMMQIAKNQKRYMHRKIQNRAQKPRPYIVMSWIVTAIWQNFSVYDKIRVFITG